MQKIAILCIGSDKISGDSLGPIVGDLLRKKYKLKCPVYGTTEYPVNGINLIEYRDMLNFYHSESVVIAIDAAVGTLKEVGQIKIRAGGIRAGGAINCYHDMLGDVGIMGVVTEKCDNVLSALMETPFAFVEDMAGRIAAIVASFCFKLLHQN